MTAMMRQIRKQTLTIMPVLLALWLGSLVAARADGIAPQFVTDPLTGVALDGFDPVSYFTEPAPLEGLPDYEYDWQGVPWYFANAADRDVFMRAPEVYAPQFGGHATTALSQGYLSDGNPQIFAVVAERLYLFYSTDTREAFLATPGPVISAARAQWTKRLGASVAAISRLGEVAQGAARPPAQAAPSP
jgi:hypothetical protein